MSSELFEAVLRFDGEEYAITDLEKLSYLMRRVQEAGTAEAWMERGDEAMCLLTNQAAQRAFLMLVTEDNLAGFHAVSGKGAESEEEVGFLLGNGQADLWEVSDTIPLAEGIRAFESFFHAGGRAPFVEWQDDSH